MIYRFDIKELQNCRQREKNYLSQLINGEDEDGKPLSYHEVELLKDKIKRVRRKIGFQKYLRTLPNQTLIK